MQNIHCNKHSASDLIKVIHSEQSLNLHTLVGPVNTSALQRADGIPESSLYMHA